MTKRSSAPVKVMQYTEEFIGEVMSRYAQGASSVALARIYKDYGLSPRTIDKWAERYGIKRGATLSQNAREEIGAAVMRLMLVSIESEIRIVEVTKDEDWLKKQTAGDLALMYATMHDKNVHLLSSMQAAERQAAEQAMMERDLYDDEGEDGDDEE